jgi:hypothetical protein
MDHLEPIRDRIRAAPVGPPLPPLAQLACHAVGGLTDVVVAVGSDLLLVGSSQDRGVFDCHTGQRLRRSRYRRLGPLDWRVIPPPDGRRHVRTR